MEAVLNGDEPYPEGLKMKMLSEWAANHAVDGVAMGIRTAESNARNINYALNGYVYHTKSGIRCQPIAKWTAKDSLCLALLFDAPINPVYEKMEGVGNIEQLHDGTWWPHGAEDRSGWMKRYYPECYELYRRALLVGAKKNFKSCVF